MKNVLLAAFLIPTLSFFGQKFKPDVNGHINDPKFLALIKERGYDLVGAMDTITVEGMKIPLLMATVAYRDNKQLFIDWNGTEYTDINALRRKVGFPEEPEYKTFDDRTAYNEPIPPPHFEREEYFLDPEKFREFKVNGRAGYIIGKDTIIAAKYDYINEVKGDNNRLWLKAVNGQSEGVYSVKGKLIIPVEYENITVLMNGTPRISYIVKKNGKYGACSSTGQITVPLEYNELFWNSNGHFLEIKIRQANSRAYKVGAVDTLGQLIVPPIYSRVQKMKHENVYYVYPFHQPNRAKFGIINNKGIWVVDTICSDIEGLGNSLNMITRHAGFESYSGIVNTQTGELLLPLEFSISNYYEVENRYIYRKIGEGEYGNDEYTMGMIDTNGRILFQPVYEHLEYIPSSKNVILTINGKSGVVSHSGDTIVPFIYEDLKSPRSLRSRQNHYSDKLLAFRSNKKWGIMLLPSKIVITAKYDEITIDNFGILCQTETSFSVLTAEGKELLPEKQHSGREIKFEDGILEYRFNGKRMLADLYGNSLER